MIHLLFLGAALLAFAGAALVWLIQRHVASQSKRFDPEPYAPEFADPVDAVHDGYQRAKYFTEEEAAQIQATAQAPAIVAGPDLDRTHRPMAEVNLRLRLMVDADDALRELRELPFDLAPLYVVPEEQR